VCGHPPAVNPQSEAPFRPLNARRIRSRLLSALHEKVPRKRSRQAVAIFRPTRANVPGDARAPANSSRSEVPTASSPLWKSCCTPRARSYRLALETEFAECEVMMLSANAIAE